jgi:Mg2+ and Co2+ transporter CorA
MGLIEDIAGSALPEDGVVACSVYEGGRRVADIKVDEAGEWSKKEGHVVWIGLWEPSRELLHRVQREFQLHDLAIEDAEHPHQRPKLEQYGDALFIVARTAQLIRGRVSSSSSARFSTGASNATTGSSGCGGARRQAETRSWRGSRNRDRCRPLRCRRS